MHMPFPLYIYRPLSHALSLSSPPACLSLSQNRELKLALRWHPNIAAFLGVQKFEQMFEDMDSDGSHDVTWPEFISYFERAAAAGTFGRNQTGFKARDTSSSSSSSSRNVSSSDGAFTTGSSSRVAVQERLSSTSSSSSSSSSSASASAAFDALDTNGDGVISRDEFLAAARRSSISEHVPSPIVNSSLSSSSSSFSSSSYAQSSSSYVQSSSSAYVSSLRASSQAATTFTPTIIRVENHADGRVRQSSNNVHEDVQERSSSSVRGGASVVAEEGERKGGGSTGVLAAVEWTCSICAKTNRAYVSKCGVCGRAKPPSSNTKSTPKEGLNVSDVSARLGFEDCGDGGWGGEVAGVAKETENMGGV